jgi:prepilin-type N-terminal cleavage/methylation domain-containing protein
MEGWLKMIRLIGKTVALYRLKKIRTFNEGFTVIELILAIAIAGIIMGAVGSYLVFNLASFNDTKDIIDIQYEGQLAINQLTDIARESTGIIEIKNILDTSELNSDGKINNPSELVFYHKKLNGLGNSELTKYAIKYDFSISTMTCEITSNYNASTNLPASPTDSYVMAKQIASFQVEPTNMGSTSTVDFEYAKSLIMYFDMADGDATMSMHSEVKFRNYNK